MTTGITIFNTKRRIGKTERRIREYALSLNEKLRQSGTPLTISVKSEKTEGGYRLLIDVVSEKGNELKGETLKMANKLRGYAMLFNALFRNDKLPAFVEAKKEELENGYRLIVEIKMEEGIIKYEKELEEKRKMKQR